jgi:hypothetical protein
MAAQLKCFVENVRLLQIGSNVSGVPHITQKNVYYITQTPQHTSKNNEVVFVLIIRMGPQWF